MSDIDDHFDPDEQHTRDRIARGEYSTTKDQQALFEEVRNRRFFAPPPNGWRKAWKKICDLYWLVTHIPQVPADPESASNRFDRKVNESHGRTLRILRRLRWF